MQPRYTNLSSIEPHPDYPLKMYYADEVEAEIEKWKQWAAYACRRYTEETGKDLQANAG